MKRILFSLALITCASIQAMQPSNKREREKRSLSQFLNEREREIVNKIKARDPKAWKSLDEWLEKAEGKLRTDKFQTNDLWYEHNAKNRKRLVEHVTWLKTLQRIHFPVPDIFKKEFVFIELKGQIFLKQPKEKEVRNKKKLRVDTESE